MTDSQSPFPEAGSESSPDNPQPPQPRQRIDGDEWIAIWVTLITLGGILIWGVTTQTRSLFVNNLFSTPPPSPQAEVSPELTEPQATVPERVIEAPMPTTRPSVDRPVAPSPVVVAPSPVISPEHWSQPFADQLVEQGYLTETITDNWQPNKEITRAELAAYIVEIFDDGEGQAIESAKDFPDLPPQEQAKRNIDRAVELGFMEGYAEGEFRPERKVTREELLVALASGLKLPTPNNATEIIAIYQDKQNVQDWAVEQIAAATQANLVVGYPNKRRLNPQKSVTQGEAIALLHQALVTSGEVSEIDSPYIVDSP